MQDLLNKYLTPSNARFALLSSTFGRSTNVSDEAETEFALSMNIDLVENIEEDSGDFDPVTAGDPHIEPIFGTRFWCHAISQETLNGWRDAATPCLPSASSLLSLPPHNPFVPKHFDLKPLPIDDSHHPLLHCSLKVCVSVGKRKVRPPIV